MGDPHFFNALGGYGQRRVSGLFSLAGMILMVSTGVSIGQEPGLLQGRNAVRFEEAPGLFHYITPCYKSTPKRVDDEPNAWCWPVRAAHVQRVDGKIVQSETSRGVIEISDDEVRFLPDSASPKIPLVIFPRMAVAFGHKTEAAEARIGNNVGVYLFLFADVCFGCKLPPPAPDGAKRAQLEEEFALFHEALTNYASVAERLRDLSLHLRVRITPDTEPIASANAMIMSTYSELNHRLTDVCPSTTKDCVLAYANYQSCKVAGSAAACGPSPSCSAEFVLPKDFDSTGLSVVMEPTADVAELRPAILGRVITSRDITGGKGISPRDITGNNVAVPISAGVMAGQLLAGPAPEYPTMAKVNHVSGTVLLRAVIGKDGKIQSLKVISPTDPYLNGAAMDAVKKWRYKPYTLNGNPVEVDTTITVNFNLSGGSGSGRQGPSGPTQMPGMPPS